MRYSIVRCYNNKPIVTYDVPDDEENPTRYAVMRALADGVSLEGADLGRADLSGLTIRDANLRWANLEGAHLNGTTFERVDLTGTILKFAIADESKFFDVQGQEILADEARFFQASFVDCDFSRSSWIGANCESAWFEDVSFSRAIMKDWYGAKVQCKKVRFDLANLRGSSFHEADVRETSFASSSLFRASFSSATLIHDDFSQAILSESQFYEALVRQSRFEECECRFATFTGARLVRVQANRSDFTSTQFDKAYLIESMFDHAIFKESSWKSAHLLYCNAEHADFSKAHLSSTDMTGTGIAYAKFNMEHFAAPDLSKARQTPFGAKEYAQLFTTPRIDEAYAEKMGCPLNLLLDEIEFNFHRSAQQDKILGR